MMIMLQQLLDLLKTSMVVNPESVMGETESIELIKVYSDYSDIESIEVLRGVEPVKDNKPKLGYAFTWLKNNYSDNGLNWR